MEDVVLYGMAGGLGLLVVLVSALLDLGRDTSADTLKAAGLTWRDAERADGVVDGVLVEARAQLDSKNNRTAVQVLLPPLPPTHLLDLRLETVGARLAASIGTPDLQIGDPAFDEAVAVYAGDEPRARALLDRPTRDRVVRAVAAGGQLEEGRWQLWLGRQHHGAGLRDAVRLLVDAHLALRVEPGPVELRRRLRAIATGDRPAAVRLGALRCLIRIGADEQTLEHCQRDVDVEVRLEAATARGEHGRDTLLEIMRTSSRSWRVRAAVALGDLGGVALDAVEQTLIAALADPDLAAPAADGLGRFGRPGVVGALSAADRDNTHPRAVRAAIRSALQAARARVPATAVGALGLADPGAGEGALGLADPPTAPPPGEVDA